MNKKKTIIWTLLTVLAYLPIFARHEIVKESIPIGYIVWGVLFAAIISAGNKYLSNGKDNSFMTISTLCFVIEICAMNAILFAFYSYNLKSLLLFDSVSIMLAGLVLLYGFVKKIL